MDAQLHSHEAVLEHGFKPLAYSTLRYGAATVIFTWFTYGVERSFSVRRRDIVVILVAAALGIWLNRSRTRTRALVLAAGWVVALTGFSQTTKQSFDFGGLVWVCLVYATLGPLVLTNILWLRAINRVGPSRATLVANLQSFIARASVRDDHGIAGR